MINRLFFSCCFCIGLLSVHTGLKADITESIATNVLRLDESEWTSGIQINQLTFNESKAHHHEHRGKIGISETSVNARVARGGTSDTPETALYLSVNRYKFTGGLGHHIDPMAHYLPMVAVGGYVEPSDNFQFNYLVGMQMNLHHWNLATSTRYVGMLSGRSPIGGNWSIDYGVYALTGCRRTQVYPLIGFDYVHDKWSIKAIYPLEISVRHRTTQSLTLIATTRWNNDRFRMSHEASRHLGFVQYRSYGAEVGFDWRFIECMNLGFSIGQNFQAKLATYNHMGNKADHYHVNSCLYSQVNLSVAF